MTVLTSRMVAATKALYTLADASTDLDDDAIVVLGPFSDADSEAWTAKQRLAVGASEVTDDETVAVDGDQNFRTLGARIRDEQFVVHLVAEGWNGEGDMSAAMDSCAEVVAAVELMIRPTAANTDAHTLGQVVMWAGIGHEQVTLDNNDSGAYCRIVFDVSCRANLMQTS